MLEDVFGQDPDVSAWGMFGVLVAWIAFFRVVHYLLFLRASAPFLKTSEASNKVSSTLASGESNHDLDNTRTYEMVAPQDPVDKDYVTGEEP